MNSTIQIRIDKNTKEKARKKFKEAGLDLSSGIKSYLAEVVRSKHIPAVRLTPNGYTSELEEKMIQETDYILKHGKSYKNTKEMFIDVLKD